jgi:hypothetical protein
VIDKNSGVAKRPVTVDVESKILNVEILFSILYKRAMYMKANNQIVNVC